MGEAYTYLVTTTTIDFTHGHLVIMSLCNGDGITATYNPEARLHVIDFLTHNVFLKAATDYADTQCLSLGPDMSPTKFPTKFALVDSPAALAPE